MPQMAPINWLSLFFSFIMIFFIFIILNYYSFNYKPKTFKTMKKENMLYWKW
uniref:ATP synthase complex subunit 8 n=1 Tax=Naupactus xanthographus TaxID=114905 RepID=D8WKQ3_NAUXA|nr:ATP synthase F0 subunit 8 [Naupactus xanthographus]ACZ58586.1 ATP synthase F0 subunit 8 [Naupactus xanthographus]